MNDQKSQLQSNVSSIMDSMSKKSQNEQLLQALNLLYKMLLNIFNNPVEQKFRSIKMTNATLKAKLFSIQEMDKYLESLGFIFVEESYTFFDDNISNIMVGLSNIKKQIDQLEFQNMSPEDQQKKLEVEKQQREMQQKYDEEKKRVNQIQQISQLDKIEQSQKEKPKDSVANVRQFGSNKTTFKDIGVDLQPKGG